MARMGESDVPNIKQTPSHSYRYLAISSNDSKTECKQTLSRFVHTSDNTSGSWPVTYSMYVGQYSLPVIEIRLCCLDPSKVFIRLNVSPCYFSQCHAIEGLMTQQWHLAISRFRISHFQRCNWLTELIVRLWLAGLHTESIDICWRRDLR